MILVALFFISVFTSIISALTGMAGGVLFLSLLTFFLPTSAIVPIHGIVQLMSNSSRAIYLRKHIRFSFLKYYAIGIPFGVVISIYLIKQVPDPRLPLALIALLIFYTVFKPKKLPELKIPNWGFSLVGFSAGVLALLIGAVGPFIAPFFVRKDMEKLELVGTKASLQIVSHFVKIPAFIFLSFNYFDYLPVIGVCVAGALIGTKLGVYLLHKLHETHFQLLFRAILALAGLRIIYKIATMAV